MKQETEVQKRTPDQVRQHYLIEKELAGRLKASRPEERRHLYNLLYDELYQRLPDHPRWTVKRDPEARKRAVQEELGVLKRFLTPEMVFLEIGPGDCQLSLEVARCTRHVYAVDVSSEALSLADRLGNLETVLTDGISIPVPSSSIDLAYSNQLIEHLHPDDTRNQMASVLSVLKPGGMYICRTPNRLNGPHDVSRGFDEVATGFHLKEYSYRELTQLFRDAGFDKIRVLFTPRSFCFSLPVFSVKLIESALAALPACMITKIGSWPLIRTVLRIQMLGVKGG